MLFHSLSYIFFLTAVFFMYWVLPHKYRWIILLLSSYFFYMSWGLQYIILLLGITLIAYISGLLIEKSISNRKKKMVLAGTSVICLGMLFVFKYLNFALTLNLMLPAGISFYTLQTLGYIFDVYKGEIKAERHFGYYVIFISFFPYLISGPIERAGSLLPQIKKAAVFDYSGAINGLKKMLWGYFKKIVIADTLAIYVDAVFNSPHRYTGLLLVLGVFFFTIQIYCDFSGYSDIAVGTARLLGFNLTQNFRSPYFATSINEFWKRWHISLSTWFRDYMYIPLGGNRCSPMRQRFNLMVTFLASGLWHGANWTYILWGALHGAAQITENLFQKQMERIKKWKIGKFISWLMVFMFCNVAWIFFRADSVQDALYILTHWNVGFFLPVSYINNELAAMGMNKTKLLVELVLLFVVEWGTCNGRLIKKCEQMPTGIKWIGYFIFIWIMWLCIPAKGSNRFIYFQF